MRPTDTALLPCSVTTPGGAAVAAVGGVGHGNVALLWNMGRDARSVTAVPLCVLRAGAGTKPERGRRTVRQATHTVAHGGCRRQQHEQQWTLHEAPTCARLCQYATACATCAVESGTTNSPPKHCT
jgi:hypothetical protein